MGCVFVWVVSFGKELGFLNQYFVDALEYTTRNSDVFDVDIHIKIRMFLNVFGCFFEI